MTRPSRVGHHDSDVRVLEQERVLLFGDAHAAFESARVLLELDLRRGQLGAVPLQLAVRLNRVLEGRDEQIEDLLFFGGDREAPAEEHDLDPEDGRGGAQAAVVQDRLDARQQLLGLVGLGEEIVGPALEPADDVHRLVERREQHHRERRGATP